MVFAQRFFGDVSEKSKSDFCFHWDFQQLVCKPRAFLLKSQHSLESTSLVSSKNAGKTPQMYLYGTSTGPLLDLVPTGPQTDHVCYGNNYAHNLLAPSRPCGKTGSQLLATRHQRNRLPISCSEPPGRKTICKLKLHTVTLL